MDKRIVELEKKVMFQEHMIDELNEAFTQQQQQIDLLEKQVRVFAEQLKKEIHEPPRDLPLEKPPHY